MLKVEILLNNKVLIVFLHKVGLPAKSGVSGVIMLVVPNVMGIIMWSPLLDECGNSVRGLKFCKVSSDVFMLTKNLEYSYSNFDRYFSTHVHAFIFMVFPRPFHVVILLRWVFTCWLLSRHAYVKQFQTI